MKVKVKVFFVIVDNLDSNQHVMYTDINIIIVNILQVLSRPSPPNTLAVS